MKQQQLMDHRSLMEKIWWRRSEVLHWEKWEKKGEFLNSVESSIPDSWIFPDGYHTSGSSHGFRIPKEFLRNEANIPSPRAELWSSTTHCLSREALHKPLGSHSLETFPTGQFVLRRKLEEIQAWVPGRHLGTKRRAKTPLCVFHPSVCKVWLGVVVTVSPRMCLWAALGAAAPIPGGWTLCLTHF